MALLLKHQSIDEFLSRLRSEYRNSSNEYTVKLARFVISRIQAGDLTDAEIRAKFGLTVTQWNNLKTRMTNLVTADNTIKSAIGE